LSNNFQHPVLPNIQPNVWLGGPVLTGPALSEANDLSAVMDSPHATVLYQGVEG
jgi:hypothetical protein